MCVVIDADTFTEISDDNDEEFKPLRKWIEQKEHTVIHGGSEYAKQMGKHGKFVRYLAGLDRAGNPPHRLDTEIVDSTQEFLERSFILATYNDHHIAAILFVSGCRVVSSHDKGLHRLIKECCSNDGKNILKNMPNLMVNSPRIYQDKSHEAILKERSVSHCCV